MTIVSMALLAMSMVAFGIATGDEIGRAAYLVGAVAFAYGAGCVIGAAIALSEKSAS